jgi:predicted nuclease of restriction endonuclease-like (RecB) superfamily
MDISTLLGNIQEAHQWFAGQAARQINTALTMRNWIIGMYLFEYEQKGQDRAQYGAALYANIAERAKKMGLKGMSKSNLYGFQGFYLTYPQIFQFLAGKFQSIENQEVLRLTEHASEQIDIVQSKTGKYSQVAPNDIGLLINRLTYTHFVELLRCDTELKRTFYETQALINNWNVRELRRAMDSLLFERTGLSTDKAAVLEKHRSGSGLDVVDFLKNPMILDFLGLSEKAEYTETDLEQAIINHLQHFLMEAGRGFCFEARQRRISFDNRHYRIDLVFYHRILKCHVLFDLKIGEFDHSDAGQMNLYLNYYRENEMSEGDNLPVGIILCAEKNHALVHYATGNLPQPIFVSKYLLNLPSEAELRRIVEEEQEKLRRLK